MDGGLSRCVGDDGGLNEMINTDISKKGRVANDGKIDRMDHEDVVVDVEDGKDVEQADRAIEGSGVLVDEENEWEVL